MAVIIDDLLEEALSGLTGGEAQEENELAADVDDSVTTITFSHDIDTLQRNSLIEIGEEVMRVWSVDNNAKSATVRRGYNNTTAYAHTAGDLVSVNPRWSKARLLRALEHEIVDLSSPANNLYAMDTTTFNYSASTLGYDLSSVYALQDVYAVRQETPGSSEDWYTLTDWTLMRNQENSGGLRLKLPTGYPGQIVRIEYKAEFWWDPADTPVSAMNIEDATNVPSNMYDILVMGMTIRVGTTQEIRRNQLRAQGSSRRAEEVPPQAVANSFRYLQALRQQRIQAEAARLSRMYPDYSR